jgi:hypothetical protein
LFSFVGLDQIRRCEHTVAYAITAQRRKLQTPNRGKESRKYNRCGEISPSGQSQGTEVMKEIPQSEPVKLFQLRDSLRVQYSLQMIWWKSFDDNENFDLSEFDARDSFLRYLMVIRHALPPHSSASSEASD